MRGRKILVAVVIGTLVLTTAVAAFAATTVSGTGDQQQSTVLAKRDPLKVLQDLKAKIQQKLAEGKVSKQRADAMTANIDNKIKQIQNFNGLTLEQKKAKLIKDFSHAINKRVQEGKLAQDKSKELIAKCSERINKWDGKGYPFLKKGAMKQFQSKMKNFKHPIMAKKVSDALDNAVRNGKITAEQKQGILDYLKTKKIAKN